MDTGVILSIFAAVAVVGVFVYLARRIDQRHHQNKLDLIQERIRRQQEGSDGDGEENRR